MIGFDRFVVVDWSARSAPSPVRPTKDAIWMAIADADGTACHYFRTRSEAMEALSLLFETALQTGQRVLAGFDFPFGYPRGFAHAVTGTDDPLAVWQALADRIVDKPDNSNNRFDVATDLNRLFPGIGPFWGCPHDRATVDLPERGRDRADHGMRERRKIEDVVRSAQPCWKLYTTGSVGSQVLLGLPHLHSLRQRFGPSLSVSPFEPNDTPLVLAEIYPSLLADEVKQRAEPDEILDRAQVRVLAGAFRGLDPTQLRMMLAEGDAEEGWILGSGHENSLRAALQGLRPPPLNNDCFALPQGVEWTPVDDALAHLRTHLSPVTQVETIPIQDALGRVVADTISAKRASPPSNNTAVDGYGFAGGRPEGVHILPLIPGRAAAGVPFAGAVPEGHAIRVLTGGALPAGVDTVILEEDVTLKNDQIAFRGPLKGGANAREAGEDVRAGAEILTAGRQLTPADLALMSSVGISTVPVRRQLSVAILSTGDELLEPGSAAGLGQIYDANRPMLRSMMQAFGYDTVDMGRISDDRSALRAALDAASDQADVILTSGGASAGDEDHVSALLGEAGTLQHWRIAVKPGRPLALALWRGKPVFGLPGNPVAAMVCTLIFARPALGVLAGQHWQVPQGFEVPAAFEKRKKPGRREYLRARIREGRADVFASEGSGRISGLSWAEGLVEIGDGACHIKPGDPVRFIPFGSFGL